MLCQSFSIGQDNTTRTFLQTNNKLHLYYVELGDSAAYVFEMGRYLDKGGSGYAIDHTDTLSRQPTGNYLGKTTQIEKENNNYYLLTNLKKTKKFFIDAVKNISTVNIHLNNAYFLGSYFKLAEAINIKYPLQHQSFRNGFSAWDDLSNKEADVKLFRVFTDERLKKMKDSITHLQDGFTALANYIIRDGKTLQYQVLKDSLLKLPATFSGSGSYYGSVVSAIAKQNPAYFFRLAEDFPENRSLIFSAVPNDSELINGLKTVEGYDEIKKQFFKDRKFNKTIFYRIVGTYAVIAGVVALLIVSVN